MFLHQEYLNRHKISVGWMGYPQKGTLVFRSINPDRHRWSLLNFQREGPEYHPQSYRIMVVVPKRNSGELNGHIKKHQIEWDDFEVWVRRYILNAHKLKIVKDPIERKLTLWEIYVYCNDKWFADWGVAYKKMLFKTLNLELTLEKRASYFGQMLNVIGETYPKALKSIEASLSYYKEDRWIGENAKIFNSDD